MSDFKEIVRRIVMDYSFRTDMLRDLEGTLRANEYKVSDSEIGELRGLGQGDLDELDERLANRNFGGPLFGSGSFGPTLGGVFGFRGGVPAIRPQVPTPGSGGIPRPGGGPLPGWGPMASCY